MLRRPPTTLTLTSEDIAIYEDKRSREATQRRTNNNPAGVAAHRYDPEELLSNSSLNPYSHLPPTHSKRRTILDPPLPPSARLQAHSPSVATQHTVWGTNNTIASEQDLRNFAAQQQRPHQQLRQQRHHHQHRGAGATHGVHFTPVPRGGSVPAHSNGGPASAADIGDDSDLLPAGLSSPPEAPALLQSSEDEEQHSDDDDDDDDDEEESPEDEEMVDYDAPGHMQALPRSARPVSYTQHHQHQHYPSAAATNLSTPVNTAGAQAQQHQQHQQQTPIPSNHTSAATSQIPQAPQRRTHARTVSASASARGGGGGGGGARGGAGLGMSEPTGAQPPPAPTRMTRSREERIGAPAPGTRRTGR